MGVRYDYFRAPSATDVRRHMDENDASSPVPATFDGVELKTIDPSVALGMLIAFATDKEWSVDLVNERLIWPEGGEHDTEYGGPWANSLDDRVRDVLAGIPADHVSTLAKRWATIEEFNGRIDLDLLCEVIAEFTALAVRARENGESLYCWS
jgi:hypothetical protein